MANDNISSVYSDSSNNNNIGFEEEDDIVHDQTLMDSSNNTNLYNSNMKTFLMENHFSSDKVCERKDKLKNYHVQLKLLKLLSNEGMSPKIFLIS